MRQERRWGTCGLVGGLLGAGAGAGIGVAINENTGDHENTVAWTTGLGGAGAFLGAMAGHYHMRPHSRSADSSAATASSTAATTAATPAAAGEVDPPWGAFRLQQVEDPAG